MAYKNSKENISDIIAKVDGQGKQIEEQISITKLFIVVVAVTLVLTLTTTIVGLGGLYISAFNDKNSNNIITGDQIKELIVNSIYLQQSIMESKQEIQLLRAKNPYLK